MKTLLTFGALLFISGTTALAADRTATVKFMNKSDWEIHHMYLSPAESEEWGEDQLGEATIPSGGAYTLTGIPTGATYDFKIIDEEGDECVIEGIEIRGSDKVKITNKDLLECQAATAQG